MYKIYEYMEEYMYIRMFRFLYAYSIAINC